MSTLYAPSHESHPNTSYPLFTSQCCLQHVAYSIQLKMKTVIVVPPHEVGCHFKRATGRHVGTLSPDEFRTTMCCCASAEGETPEVRPNDGNGGVPRWPEPSLTALHNVRPRRQATGSRRPRSAQHIVAHPGAVLRAYKTVVPMQGAA